jgi:cAMP phosphodiesterase
MEVGAFQLQHAENSIVAELTANGVQPLWTLGAILSNIKVTKFVLQQVRCMILKELEAVRLFDGGYFDELRNAVADVTV